MSLRLFKTLRSDQSGAAAAPSESNATPRRAAKTVGLVFDMGDVLFDATAWRRWLLRLLGRLGLHAGYRCVFEIWDRDYLDAVHCGRRDYAEAFETFLRDLGLNRGQINEVVEASQAAKRQIEAEVRPFPGVRPTLDRLHRHGVRMAVLSDSESPADAIRRRLTSLGLNDFFSAVVSSVELRQTKPAPIGYHRAAEALSLAPAQLAFVGHDAEELRGARRAGMTTIAFNYERDAAADLFIVRFEELLQIVDRSHDGMQRGAA